MVIGSWWATDPGGLLLKDFATADRWVLRWGRNRTPWLLVRLSRAGVEAPDDPPLAVNDIGLDAACWIREWGVGAHGCCWWESASLAPLDAFERSWSLDMRMPGKIGQRWVSFGVRLLESDQWILPGLLDRMGLLSPALIAARSRHGAADHRILDG
ncbi:hypothetical protein ACLOJK_022698 [Asimina triloba]